MRKLATFAFSFAAAVFLAVYFLPTEYDLYIAVGLAVLSSIGYMLKNDLGKRLIIILLASALGLTWYSGYNRLFRQPAEKYDGKDMHISALVTDYSQYLGYGTKVQANIVIDGKSWKSLLYFYSNDVELIPGDVVSVDAKVKLADTIYNESTLIYYSNGYTLKASTSDQPNIYRPEKFPVRFYPAKLAHAMGNMLDRLYPQYESSFMRALLLGDDQYVSDTFLLQMKTAGLTHIFVVSGLHIGFLVSIISLLAIRRRLTAAIAFPVIIFFSAMNGFTPSVCRASIMYIMSMSASLLYRDSDGITNLSLAMLVLLAVNPFVIANAAFQLSFACCAGITLFTPSIYQWLKDRKIVTRLYGIKIKSTKLVKYVLNFILSSISTSFGVMLSTSPILAICFGSVCVISPLSNLLTLWAFSLCFMVGMVILPVAWLWFGLGSVLSNIPVLLIRYISAVVPLMCKIPFATVSVNVIFYKLWLIYVYVVVILSVVLKIKRPYVQIASCILAFFAAYFSNMMYVNETNLSFTALDVGQGQCLVATSRGDTVVIDCGGTKSPDSALDSYLCSLDSNNIDVLIVTHYHSDHAEYVPYIINTYDVDTVIIPDVEDTSGLRQEIIQAASANDCETVVLSSDTYVAFGSSGIDLFGPLDGSSSNELCLSMVISYEDYDILVTADMDENMENQLVSQKGISDIELLVVGHHGSKYSTGQQLLEAAEPEDAIISVGSNNYGHPTEEALYRLESFGVDIMRTDELGNITFRK